MYLPKHFEQADVDAIRRLITAFPLGAIVVATDDGLQANHVPLLLYPEPAPWGTLRGHVARANPLARALLKDPTALVIFQGPDGFISPSWYPSKAATAKVVPTWNYAVVHARGPLRFVEDPIWLRSNVEALTTRHESTQAVPWKVSDAPDDFIDKMIASIIGIEIELVSLVGKWKLSQNRPATDRQGVVEALVLEGTEHSRTLAEWVTAAADNANGPASKS